MSLDQILEIEANEVWVAVQFYAFERQFGHEIRIKKNGKVVALRTDDQLTGTWPPAPPIQDIHFEERDDCRILFGVGMAGNTHYSMSIAESPSANLTFEFAAHVKNQPELLGTSYQFDYADGLDRQALGALLTPHKSSKSTIREFDSTDLRLIVEPTELTDTTVPRTVQWGFDIRL